MRGNLATVIPVVCAALSAALCAACGPGSVSAGPESVVTRQGFLFGTHVVLSLVPVPGRDVQRDLADEFAALEAFQRRVDPYQPSSLVSRLNAAGALRFAADAGGEETLRLLERARALAEGTDGAFDPCLLAVTRVWGFSSGKLPTRPPDPTAIAAALPKCGWRKLTIDGREARLAGGAQVELGAIAKGTAADLSAARLRGLGYRKGILDLGGNLYVMGPRVADGQGGAKWRVGIQHPRDRTRYWGTLETVDRGVVTSGDYERGFVFGGRRYHHLLDPATGYPATNAVSVTVVGPRAERCDALCKPLFVYGAARGFAILARFPGYEALVVTERGGKLASAYSSGFVAATGWKQVAE